MLEIRKMLVGDHERVRQVLCNSFHWLALREQWNEMQLDHLMDDCTVEAIAQTSANQDCFVALLDGIVVGMVSVWKDEIAKLYVDPGYHRHGIGKALFANGEESVRRSGYNVIRLRSTASSVPFYRAMGMVVERKTTWQSEIFRGCVLFAMKKQIIEMPEGCA